MRSCDSFHPQAQLRSQLLRDLRGSSAIVAADVRVRETRGRDAIVASCVAQYLNAKGFKYALSVFLPECGVPSTTAMSREYTIEVRRGACVSLPCALRAVDVTGPPPVPFASPGPATPLRVRLAQTNG